MGEKKSETIQKPQLVTAMVHKRLERSTRLLNGLKKHRIQIFIFSDEKTFIENPLFKKQNGRVVTFGNDVSEHRTVSTTKHPPSIRMFDVVASNWEKMPQAWFKRGYRLCRLHRSFGDGHGSSSMGQEDY